MAVEREFGLLYANETKSEIIAKRKSVKNRKGCFSHSP